MLLLVTVSGQTTLVRCEEISLIASVRDHALEQVCLHMDDHPDNPPSYEWEVRDEKGRVLPPLRTLEQLGLLPNARLFLARKPEEEGE